MTSADHVVEVKHAEEKIRCPHTYAMRNLNGDYVTVKHHRRSWVMWISWLFRRDWDASYESAYFVPDNQTEPVYYVALGLEPEPMWKSRKIRYMLACFWAAYPTEEELRENLSFAERLINLHEQINVPLQLRPV